ncbi:MAG TPA: hypothetical protein VMV69_27470 [Pirellulales bacterium]|nr:hypothetical protein [Pirellulales bacterium]
MTARHRINRRQFVHGMTALGLATPAVMTRRALAGEAAAPVHVLVWDEQQPAQKEAYQNFLGNAIAEHLKSCEGIDVRSVRLNDPDQGLTERNLEWADVVVWWGHVRQSEITPETARAKIVEPIKAGKLSLR